MHKRKKTGVQLCIVIGIMLLAVLMGYFTARFIMAPLLGYDTDVLKVSLNLPIGDNAHKKNNEKNDSHYALQFGAFSSKDSANELKKELEEEGINVDIIKLDNKYKVIGNLLDTKEDALKQLKDNQLKDICEDVFVTTIKSTKED